jgi:hypothetical protein
MIKVYAPIFLKFHAEKLVENLIGLCYEAEMIAEVKDDDSLYILYCAFQIKHLPKRYIVYQCEQWGSHWFGKWYWEIINGALQVWDFAECNINKYPVELESKVFHIPAGLIKEQGIMLAGFGNTPPIRLKDIDVVFYGAVNKHREDVMNQIRHNKINITCIQDKYGDEMIDILSRAKVVLNIHFYEKGHLETFRINEALSCGCNVVSERNDKAFYPSIYRDFVRFGTNTNELCFAIKTALNNPPKYDLSVLDNTEYIKEALSKFIAQ